MIQHTHRWIWLWMLCLAVIVGLNHEAAAVTPIALKTSQASLMIDEQGRIALKPGDAAIPSPADFQSPLWVITLAEGADVFNPGRAVTARAEGKPQITKVDGGVRLVYDKVRCNQTDLNVQLDLRITVAGDEFRFDSSIINKTRNWVVRYWKYPILLDIEAHGGGAESEAPVVYCPDGLGRRYTTRQVFGPRREFAYPSRLATMQWLTFTTPAGGLYFASHDEKCAAKTFAIAEGRGAGYDVSLMHRPYCAPGASWDAPTTVVMSYRGSWHTAARHYRQWVASWLDVMDRPQWAQNSTGWLLAILKQQNGDLMWNYRDLDRLADLAEARGLDTLGLFGWAHGGHDREYPDYIPDPSMGGPQTLRESIARVRRRGLHVILYANGQLIDSATEFYRLQGTQTMVADRSGKPLIQMYNKFKSTSTPLFVTACTAAPVWRQRLMKLAQQAHDLGADGILYDQLGGVGPKECFESRHGHSTPAASEDRFDLIRQIARPMHQLDPNFIIMTEGVVDAEQADIPYFHGCGTGFGYFTPSAAATPFPELFRYTFPQVVATERIPNPFLTRNYANFACMYGLRFEIESRYTGDVKYLTGDQVPAPAEYADCNSPPDVQLLQKVPRDESAAYMRRVTEFRRTHGDLLLRGRFIDLDGVKVEAEQVVGKAFESDTQIGVLLWNPTDQNQSTKVTVDGCQYVAAYEPEAKNPVDVHTPIAAESIRLLIWNKP